MKRIFAFSLLMFVLLQGKEALAGPVVITEYEDGIPRKVCTVELPDGQEWQRWFIDCKGQIDPITLQSEVYKRMEKQNA